MRWWRSRGFSLIEMLVALVLFSVVATLGVALVVSLVGLTRSQVHLAEMQQAARSAELELGRRLRAAGRGALPTSRSGETAARGLAIEVWNNQGAGGREEPVARDWPGSPLASPGSDVLVLRGVFNSPVYVVDYRGPDAFSRTQGTVRVAVGGIGGEAVQDLTPLRTLLSESRGKPDALLLVGLGGEGAFGVAELEPARSRDEGDALVLAFRTEGGLAEDFGRLSPEGRFPEGLSRVAYVGVLEEYRYFVRQRGPRHTLTRARVYPGTDIPWRRLTGELKVDLAEGIVDLQVAMGFDSELAGGRFDSDGDSIGPDDRIVEHRDGIDDDWLFNSPQDDALDDAWRTGFPARPPDLHLVRVRLLSRADRPTRRLIQPTLEHLEDRVYNEAADDPVNGPEARGRRRWISTLTVGPRSR